jgi:transcriptional regulator with XRE-family HTH domain
MSKRSLGGLLSETRAAHDLSLQEVASGAGCSPGYVHKLEADRVRSPSPRVLAGLASALGVAYSELMTAAGYETPLGRPESPSPPAAIKRYSNAEIVHLLEQLQLDVNEIKAALSGG